MTVHAIGISCTLRDLAGDYVHSHRSGSACLRWEKTCTVTDLADSRREHCIGAMSALSPLCFDLFGGDLRHPRGRHTALDRIAENLGHTKEARAKHCAELSLLGRVHQLGACTFDEQVRHFGTNAISEFHRICGHLEVCGG